MSTMEVAVKLFATGTKEVLALGRRGQVLIDAARYAKMNHRQFAASLAELADATSKNDTAAISKIATEHGIALNPEVENAHEFIGNPFKRHTLAAVASFTRFLKGLEHRIVTVKTTAEDAIKNITQVFSKEGKAEAKAAENAVSHDAAEGAEAAKPGASEEAAAPTEPKPATAPEAAAPESKPAATPEAAPEPKPAAPEAAASAEPKPAAPKAAAPAEPKPAAPKAAAPAEGSAPVAETLAKKLDKAKSTYPDLEQQINSFYADPKGAEKLELLLSHRKSETLFNKEKAGLLKLAKIPATKRYGTENAYLNDARVEFKQKYGIKFNKDFSNAESEFAAAQKRLDKKLISQMAKIDKQVPKTTGFDFKKVQTELRQKFNALQKMGKQKDAANQERSLIAKINHARKTIGDASPFMVTDNKNPAARYQQIQKAIDDLNQPA